MYAETANPVTGLTDARPAPPPAEGGVTLCAPPPRAPLPGSSQPSTLNPQPKVPPASDNLISGASGCTQVHRGVPGTPLNLEQTREMTKSSSVVSNQNLVKFW
jgi:hypothetical protein